MNHELSLNLTDLELILNKSNCSCHFINPNKTRIILWKERSTDSELSSKEVKDNVVTYYLRIGIQKFISTKFHQRQAKTEQINHGVPTNSVEPAATKQTN